MQRRILFIGVLLLCFALVPVAAWSLSLDPGSYENLTSERGFGDTRNRYTWSMAEFNDTIYAGTWSIQLDYPRIVSDLLSGNLDIGGNPLEAIGYIDSTGGKLYRYDGGKSWTEVGPTPTAENTGYREMIPYNGRLYAGTANSTTGTRLFRSDMNGENWEAVPDGPTGSISQPSQNNSNRTMIVKDGYLYVGTENNDSGGELWRYGDETTANPGWTQIAKFADDSSVAEIIEYHNDLYVGTWDFTDSFSFYRVNPNDINDFTNVTPTAAQYPELAGRSNLGVMKLVEFEDQLYLGTVNYLNGFTLMRSATPGDVSSWEIISTDGLGDMSNAYTWTLEVWQDQLMLGTFNSGLYGGMYGPLPLDGRAELWRSTDGLHWDLLMDDGFGSKYTYGIRSMVATEDILYMGTASNFFLYNPLDLLPYFEGLFGEVDLSMEHMSMLCGLFADIGTYFQGDWIGTEIYAYHSQPVPEPATIVLLGMGIVGLAAMTRRRYLK